MFAEVRQAAFKFALALLAHALHRSYQNGGGRRDASLLHDDVEIFLRAEIGSETTFVYNVIGETQAHFLRDDAAGTVRYVAEGTGVHESGSAIGGLHEIRKDGFREQRHHATGGVQIAGGDRSSIAGDADDD